MKLTGIAVAAIAAALSFSALAANRPANYVTLCAEGKTCSVSSSTRVAFGRADKFLYKQLSGSFVCNEATFGGRIAGGTNECSIPKSASSSSSSSRSSSSPSSSSSSRSSTSSSSSSRSSSSSSSSSIQPPVGTGYTFCAAPGQTCTFTGTRMVYFWDCTPDGLCAAVGSQFTNSMLCDLNASYGGTTIGNHPLGCWVAPPPPPTQPPPPPGSPAASIKGASCVSTGNVSVPETIVISSGVYDGGCKTYTYTGAGDQGDASQTPVFRVNNGATLKNVIIGTTVSAGVHVYGNVTVDNVTWLDVADTGLTVKSAGTGLATVSIKNITATKGTDRFLQINAASKVSVQNCILDQIGQTAVRQNGGTTFKVEVTLDSCRIAGPQVAVFRSDSTHSIAKLLNSYIRMTGQVCYGSWASCAYTNSFSY